MAAVTALARRLGPLPYSALARARPSELAVDPAVVVAYLDARWEESGRPDPFVVVEEGAGEGELAAAVLGGGARCAAALRYVLVESEPHRRAQQRSRLHLEPPEQALGPVLVAADPGEEAVPAPGRGPLATALGERPAGPAHVLLAAGWLSGLPFDVWGRRGAGWLEVRLAAAAGRGLTEITVPADGPLDGGGVAEGWRVPVQAPARSWIAGAVADSLAYSSGGASGQVVVLDRLVATTAELAFPAGGEPPARALAVDQLQRDRGGLATAGGPLSPLLLLETGIGSPHG